MISAFRSRWTRRALIGLAILAVVGLTVWWLGRPQPIPVVLTEIGRGRVAATIANTRAGTVEACQRTKLSTIIGGRIEVLTVKEGDRVKKGQLLMQLWSDDQQAAERLAQARSRLRASAWSRRARSRPPPSAKWRGRSNCTSRDSSPPTRSIPRAPRPTRRWPRCATAKSDVAQAEANVRLSHVQQGRTVLIAPFDGTVAKIVGEIGEYSTPSPPGVPTPPAIDLIDESCLYVKAPMDEVDAPKVREGQVVRISLDALPGQSFPGKVRRIAPYVTAVEKQARTVDIEATFDDPSKVGRLLVGNSADVEVVLATRDNVLRVPTAALLEGSRALVVDG